LSLLDLEESDGSGESGVESKLRAGTPSADRIPGDRRPATGPPGGTGPPEGPPEGRAPRRDGPWAEAGAGSGVGQGLVRRKPQPEQKPRTGWWRPHFTQ